MKTVKELQEFVGVKPDGKWGPKSNAAFMAILDQPKPPVSPTEPITFTHGGGAVVDPRSEGNIRTLNPAIQGMARTLVREVFKQLGTVIKVTSGLRTYEEQDELYAQGRTKPGPKVTGARGGYSNHNFGLAFDVTIFEGNRPIWESRLYKKVGEIGKSLGLSWGGDWKSLVDEPHFELRPKWATHLSESAMLAEFRRRTNVGQSLLT